MYVSDRVDLRRTLKKNMEKLKSHDGFVQMVIQYVRTGQKPLWVQCAETQTLQRYYNEDIAAQGKLGWMQFIKGYVSNGWVWLQKYHMWAVRETQTGPDWIDGVVAAFNEYTSGMWKLRNNEVHGETPKELRAIRLKKMQEKGQQLYNSKDRRYVPSYDAGIFKVPCRILQKQGYHAMAT